MTGSTPTSIHETATAPESLALVHTVEETAGLLKISPTFVHKLIRRGQLGSVQIGARRLVPDVDLRHFLAERRQVSGLPETPDA
ncbi:MAG: helix-turn-helix domain-containing protein [Nocardioides sp.]|jgi:excisionase family DNA binding protein